MPTAGIGKNRDDTFTAPDAPDYLRDAHVRAFRQDDAGRVAGYDPDVGGRVAARRLLGAAPGATVLESGCGPDLLWTLAPGAAALMALRKSVLRRSSSSITW